MNEYFICRVTLITLLRHCSRNVQLSVHCTCTHWDASCWSRQCIRVVCRIQRYRCRRQESSSCGRQELTLHLADRFRLRISHRHFSVIISNYRRFVTTIKRRDRSVVIVTVLQTVQPSNHGSVLGMGKGCSHLSSAQNGSGTDILCGYL